MPVRIVTDSACDLPTKYAEQLRIKVIPLRIIFGTETYYDGVDLTLPKFLGLLSRAPEPPTTSQPSPQAYLTMIAPLLEAGDDVLIITLSSGVSGTYQSAEVAARQLPPGRVSIVDSLTVSAGLGMLVSECAEAAQAGASLAEVTALAAARRDSIKLIALLDTVEYIVAGGRLSIYKAYSARKPNNMRLIFTANDLGQVEILERAQGRRRALERLLNNLERTDRDWPRARVSIAHCDSPTDAGMVTDWLQSRLGVDQVQIWETGSTIAAYVGPGALLIAF